MKKLLNAAIAIVFSYNSSFAQELKEKTKLLYDQTELVYSVDEQNKKSGPVLIRDNKSDKVYLRGAYKDDKPTGKWYFFQADGNVESYYNYDDDKLLFIDPAYIGKMQITIKSRDPEAIKNAAIPIMLYPSSTFLNQIVKDVKLEDYEFGGKTELPVAISAIVKANGQVEYMASYKVADKMVYKDIQLSHRDLAKIFIPAKYEGKPLESVLTLNTTLVNDKTGPGHKRFIWNY